MLFKICGIKDIKIIECCENHNVDFYGMIFYNKSPRNINIDHAKSLVEFSKNKKIKPVGVFVNENLDDIKSVIKFLDLKFIQLHGEENDKYLTEIKKNINLKIIKTLSIQDKNDLKKTEKFENNDYFLFDYKPSSNELPGGNAKQFDWSILSDKKLCKPWFLSGGINISNITKINKFINPDGIDLSSGVEEAPGIKNTKLIDKLFENYNEYKLL